MALHKSKNGNIVSIDGAEPSYPKMDDRHLINTINLFRKNSSTDLTPYLKELKKRNCLIQSVKSLDKLFKKDGSRHAVKILDFLKTQSRRELDRLRTQSEEIELKVSNDTLIISKLPVVIY